MRHDELKALVHEYFKNALAAQLDRLGASGPMTEQELAPLQTSQALAEASDDDFWSILHPEGSNAFLRQSCTASGIPQSEATTNPERVMHEYKLAYRDMLRTWERHRQSLDAYDYTDQNHNSQPKDEPTSTAPPALKLQQAIDEYVYEGKRAGTSQVSTQSKKVTSLGMLTELFGPDKPLATLNKQDAQHAKKVLLELPANRNKMPRTRGLSLLEAVTVPDVAKVRTTIRA